MKTAACNELEESAASRTTAFLGGRPRSRELRTSLVRVETHHERGAELEKGRPARAIELRVRRQRDDGGSVRA
jgi:hypothetical protein